MPNNVDNKARHAAFSIFGSIQSSGITPEGYGYVHYVTEEAAWKATRSTKGMPCGKA